MMLSSRYLHLHEALGLGPMWLNKDAVVRPSENAPTQTAAPASAAEPTAQPSEAAASVRQAHMAAMAAAGAATGSSAFAAPRPERPSETRPEAKARTTSAPIDIPASAAVFSDGPSPRIEPPVSPSEVMVVSICPAPEDGVAGRLFSGPAGVLLDRMLAAAGLHAHQVHKTSWVKNISLSGTRPDSAQIDAELPYICAELARSQAKAVLFLGQDFENAGQAANMAQLCGSLPSFVIPHPTRLLRQPQLKAQAWAELKKLKRLLGR